MFHTNLQIAVLSSPVKSSLSSVNYFCCLVGPRWWRRSHFFRCLEMDGVSWCGVYIKDTIKKEKVRLPQKGNNSSCRYCVRRRITYSIYGGGCDGGIVEQQWDWQTGKFRCIGKSTSASAWEETLDHLRTSFLSFRATTCEESIQQFHYIMPHLRDTDCDTGCAWHWQPENIYYFWLNWN